MDSQRVQYEIIQYGLEHRNLQQMPRMPQTTIKGLKSIISSRLNLQITEQDLMQACRALGIMVGENGNLGEYQVINNLPDQFQHATPYTFLEWLECQIYIKDSCNWIMREELLRTDENGTFIHKGKTFKQLYVVSREFPSLINHAFKKALKTFQQIEQ
ncbi:Hypothetical_protein [Hexamita inflata]|uniref:Hypothetical_protein n=1 Tax=Hexamita inflata TaxID=28002 RepID=A0AA86ULC6_9EUKA|nr:Hypothetical protein HINF_LOCUS50385 [Hexamita inflata]